MPRGRGVSGHCQRRGRGQWSGSGRGRRVGQLVISPEGDPGVYRAFPAQLRRDTIPVDPVTDYPTAGKYIITCSSVPENSVPGGELRR